MLRFYLNSPSEFYFLSEFFKMDSKDTHIDHGSRSVVIVGGGLVGCLLGVYLRKRNYKVVFYESRPDPRTGLIFSSNFSLASPSF